MAKDDDAVDGVPHVRKEPRPDFTKPPAPKKLPKAIQDTLDSEEKEWSLYGEIYDGKAPETTDTSLRYAAYASRFRTILLSAHRYVAYTSDIGESFRPIAHPNMVRAAYGVSWAYLLGDVGHEGYKAYLRNQRTLHPELVEAKLPAGSDKHQETPPGNVTSLGPNITNQSVSAEKVVPGRVPAIEDYRAVMVQRAVFQGIASMGLPAFTIHSIVRYSGQALKNVKNTRLRTWGPIGVRSYQCRI